MNKLDLFAWGCPHLINGTPSEEAMELLHIMLEENQYFHSCYDYGDQLSFIKKESNLSSKTVRLISKIYLNYPVYSSIRRGTLLRQVERISDFFQGQIDDLVLQISSIPSKYQPRNMDSIKRFIEIVHGKYRVNKIFIETFPGLENESIHLLKLMSQARNEIGLMNNVSFGFTSYESLASIGFTQPILDFIIQQELLYMPIRVLAGGANDKYTVTAALEKVLSDAKYKGFFRGITATTKVNHYRSNQEFYLARQKEIRSIDTIPYREHKKREPANNPYGISYNKKTSITGKLKELKHITKNTLEIIKDRKDIGLIYRQDFC